MAWPKRLYFFSNGQTNQSHGVGPHAGTYAHTVTVHRHHTTAIEVVLTGNGAQALNRKSRSDEKRN